MPDAGYLTRREIGHLTWLRRRPEWYRSLAPHNDARRDINELGPRAASALWAEADSPLYWIRDRALGRG